MLDRAARWGTIPRSAIRARAAASARPWGVRRAGPDDDVMVEVMELSPFRIERFYARYEHSTPFMLSSSDCQSR